MDEEAVAPSADTGDERANEIEKIRTDFRNRLMLADLRTEAVKAGMVDLDGLKLVDVSKIRLGDDDRVMDGKKIMDELRRGKPWLFRSGSSSSPSVAPASQPVRQKTAMEMSDEEYVSARAALTRQHF